MSNTNDGAFALTTLCPLVPSEDATKSSTVTVRDFLNDIPNDFDKKFDVSPMENVPNTYMCRFAVLSDVFYEGSPAKLDHLKSHYLIFVCDFHGDLDIYLTGMWTHAEEFVKNLWKECVGFKGVNDAPAFVNYIRRCQVKTTFYFNGSNGDPLEDQLKALFLKQELSRFAYEHEGLPPEELQAAFKAFIARVRPSERTPSWKAGQSRP